MKTRERALLKTGGRCAYCGVDLKTVSAWHVDHMIPVAQGGSNNLCNLVPACHICNCRKRDRTVEEFRQWLTSRHKKTTGATVAAIADYLDDQDIDLLDEALSQFWQTLNKIAPRIRFYIDEAHQDAKIP